ncbi:MAG: type II toxin-antitoxin system prevent-host-death family antitoxin [Burkholderiaceae bacterium]|nr:type II toxin-antitoxin system prevent-host-death family antitoxin [Burkholderiaceae bacterium]
MTDDVVNIHDAKTRLSKLVARAERGERITIARAGKPVAQLGPAPSKKGRRLADDDPLLNLETFAVEGPGGMMSNADIDRIVYGSS